jgi:hypothetical protein
VHPLIANYLSGWCCRTIFGQLTICNRENGQTNTFVHCVIETLKQWSTSSSNVRRPTTSGKKQVGRPLSHASIHINWAREVGVEEWFEKMTGAATSVKLKGMRSLIILICWSIWWERNTRIFDVKEKETDRIVSEIRDEAKLWIRAGAKDLALLVRPFTSE